MQYTQISKLQVLHVTPHPIPSVIQSLLVDAVKDAIDGN
jgi:hypothetical protein